MKDTSSDERGGGLLAAASSRGSQFRSSDHHAESVTARGGAALLEPRQARDHPSAASRSSSRMRKRLHSFRTSVVTRGVLALRGAGSLRGEIKQKPERVIWVPILVYTFSRVLFLDADPLLFKSTGDIGDEGYWAYEARNKVLFDQWITDDFTQSTGSAPLYAFLSFLVFKAFGVGLFTTRLVPAGAAILAILLLYLIVARYNKRLAMAGAFFLASDNAFFMYNRIGHPETLVIVFLLLNFFFLTSKSTSAARNLLGGASFMLAILSNRALSMGFSLTSPPPIFSSIHRMITSPYHRSFLLMILSLIYMRRRRILSFLGNIKGNIGSLDGIEVIGLSWFFGGLIGLLFSDLAGRRLTILIVPLVLFSSILFDKEDRPRFTPGDDLSALAFVVLLSPILSALAMHFPWY